MKYKNLLKIRKLNRVLASTKYFFYLKNSFVLFRINAYNYHVKFYIKQFFAKYCFKLYYINKKSFFLYKFKNYSFLLLHFKTHDYVSFFLNKDFDFFDPQDSSLILVAIKIKKNFLFYSFLKEFPIEDNEETIDFFIFYVYFYFLIKKIFTMKVVLSLNYIFLYNNLLVCQQFIKQPLN